MTKNRNRMSAKVTDIDPDEKCPCGHLWAEHNVFDDCEHEDARTKTGLCERCTS